MSSLNFKIITFSITFVYSLTLISSLSIECLMFLQTRFREIFITDVANEKLSTNQQILSKFLLTAVAKSTYLNLIIQAH